MRTTRAKTDCRHHRAPTNRYSNCGKCGLSPMNQIRSTDLIDPYQAILMMRTWAVYEQRRAIAIGLVVWTILTWVPNMVSLGIFLDSLRCGCQPPFIPIDGVIDVEYFLCSKFGRRSATNSYTWLGMPRRFGKPHCLRVLGTSHDI